MAQVDSNRRRLLIAISTATSLGVTHATPAQPHLPPLLIGWLNTPSPKGSGHDLTMLKEGLAALGWKEEWNIASEEHISLLSYAADRLALFHRAAYYLDRILKGAKPGDLPTKLELGVNLKTAKALGLTIPQAFLMRTDRIIE